MTSKVMDRMIYHRAESRVLPPETRMRSFLASALALAAIVALPAVSAPAAPAPAIAIDHVLLWGRTIDGITAAMAVKLGFQVKPGRDPAGLANRYVRFADGSYIELLGLTRPDAQLDPGAEADQKVLKGGPGSRSVALRSAALEQARSAAEALGWKPTQVFEGPKMANGRIGWRLFGFLQQPLSSNLFLIDYDRAWAPDLVQTPAPGDWQAARVHPNGAKDLTAYWLLSADADGDRRQLAAMGLGTGKPIRLPQIAARGFCVAVGAKAILVLQPDGPGAAADALRGGGPQVVGASVEVADLGRAQRLVERGYERPVTRYAGPFGQSFAAPTHDDLGMTIEFHAPRRPGIGACGA
jgi:hypothetical protein